MMPPLISLPRQPPVYADRLRCCFAATFLLPIFTPRLITPITMLRAAAAAIRHVLSAACCSPPPVLRADVVDATVTPRCLMRARQRRYMPRP